MGKPHGIHPDELAAMHTPGEKYQPSNGTEGECFFDAWCRQCARDRSMREGEPTEAHPMLCATHYCKDCAALWRQCDDFSFSLRSQACCTACNNAPVGGQLWPLTTPVAAPAPQPTYQEMLTADDRFHPEPTEAQITNGEG